MQYDINVLLVLIALLASILQGSTGFGYSILSMSLMPLLLPYRTAVTVTATSGVIMMLLFAVRLRKHINFKLMLYPFLSSTAASLAGIFLLVAAPDAWMRRALGGVLFLLSLYFIFFSSRLRIAQTRKNGLLAGEVSGLLSGLFNLGGLFSVAVLIVAAPQIARVALDFGPAEYFALALFGLTIIASASGDSLVKGLLMGLMGLFVSTIGMDPVGGTDRFTFNITELSSGIDIIPALIGLFAITEIMYKARDIYKPVGNIIEIKGKEKYSFRDALQYKATILKSSIIGTFIGVIPGTGAAIASFLSYNEAQRSSKHPELFGTGYGEGIVASEAANNAVTGGALVPLLTLGLPGDTNTAVLLGALTMQGIIPGPQLFVQQKQWVYCIMFALIIVNIFMYIQGRFFIKFFVNVTKVPTQVPVPVLVTLCIIGSYAVNNTTFDALLMILIGLFGYYMKKLDFPLTPMVIAIVLGPLAESNMRRALIISQGSWMIFFQKPISCFFILVAVFILFFPLIKKQLEKKKGAAAA